MPSSDSLNLFTRLPRRIQRAIDDAFDLSINPSQSDSRPAKRRKLSVETDDGGFVLESSSPRSEPEQNHSQIPLDFVPAGLQRLDLPPDDEEILAVFRNAASGWSSLGPQATTSSSDTKYVGRDDWRAVCAVLLENRPPDDGQELHGGSGEFDLSGSSDEYVVDEHNSSEVISSPSDSDDEYVGELDGPRSRRRKGKSRRAVSFDDLKQINHNLTLRQKQTCLDTFSLFFPHISTSELENQRVTIKDLHRVAKLLNEKLKADEMLEMLEMFSTSPDKTMGFKDFSCMMMAAKLA